MRRFTRPLRCTLIVLMILVASSAWAQPMAWTASHIVKSSPHYQNFVVGRLFDGNRKDEAGSYITERPDAVVELDMQDATALDGIWIAGDNRGKFLCVTYDIDFKVLASDAYTNAVKDAICYSRDWTLHPFIARTGRYWRVTFHGSIVGTQVMELNARKAKGVTPPPPPPPPIARSIKLAWDHPGTDVKGNPVTVIDFKLYLCNRNIKDDKSCAGTLSVLDIPASTPHTSADPYTTPVPVLDGDTLFFRLSALSPDNLESGLSPEISFTWTPEHPAGVPGVPRFIQIQ